MKRAALLGTVLLCGAIAACSDDGDSDMLNGSIHLNHGQVTLHTKDAPDAVINANGDLKIDDQSVQTNAAQQALLKSYYNNVLMIRTDGIATGKAGAAVGAQAIKSVAQGLANGNSDQIQQQIDAKTKAVTDAAMKICQDLANVKTNQDQLVVQLPAFKPYGNVVADTDVGDCQKDQDQKSN